MPIPVAAVVAVAPSVISAIGGLFKSDPRREANIWMNIYAEVNAIIATRYPRRIKMTDVGMYVYFSIDDAIKKRDEMDGYLLDALNKIQSGQPLENTPQNIWCVDELKHRAIGNHNTEFYANGDDPIWHALLQAKIETQTKKYLPIVAGLIAFILLIWALKK
ncbi:hypothetical protein CKK33_11485 [Mucilaginibacter sp. MD40]|uniref:hypothetical protein n=1 Tax=Mucilaginibacter sp. MD40 TaxID=2029590 RepID=UPI000BAC9DA6|nr:hypothetical protein [Mucilaginibacter sp. MD40]PAW94083.1 hypothetical protein CKK33_11485 [Mucilaginibacter sp. MD40]